jgi:large conductance mechanosensitive channel
MYGEFKAFLLKTNALALAIGVIIGIALGTVVSSLVDDVLMPPIGLLLGGVDFEQIRWVLQEATLDKEEVAIRLGSFFNAVVAFVIVAFVVWRISKMFMAEEVPAPTKPCPFCKEANAPDATKCKFCASAI